MMPFDYYLSARINTVSILVVVDVGCDGRVCTNIHRPGPVSILVVVDVGCDG